MSLSKKDRLYVFIGVYLLFFFICLSAYISTPALPSVMGRMNSMGLYTFSMVLPGIISCIAIPIGGKIGDIYGRRVTATVSILFRLASSIICGLAPNVEIFMLGLVIQAIAGGVLTSLPAAILSDVTNNNDRPKYFGILASMNGLGLILGLPIGGLLLDNFGPAWCYLSPVPVGFAGLVCLIKGYKLKPQNQSENKKIDIVGLLLLTASLAPALVWLNFGGDEFESFSPLGISLIISFVVFMYFMIRYELKAENPSIPVRLFKHNELKVSFATSMLIGPMVTICSSAIVMYGQVTLSLSALVSGLLSLPKNLIFLILPIFMGRWVAKDPSTRYKPVFILCGLGMFVGGILDLAVDESNPYILIILAMIAFGAATSSQGLAINSYVQQALPSEHIGAGAAMISLGGTIGNSVASAVFGAVLNTRYDIDRLIPQSLRNVLDPQTLSALSDPNTIANVSKLDALRSSIPFELLPDLEQAVTGMRQAYAETFTLYSIAPIAAGLLLIIISVLLINKNRLKKVTR